MSKQVLVAPTTPEDHVTDIGKAIAGFPLKRASAFASGEAAIGPGMFYRISVKPQGVVRGSALYGRQIGSDGEPMGEEINLKTVRAYNLDDQAAFRHCTEAFISELVGKINNESSSLDIQIRHNRAFKNVRNEFNRIFGVLLDTYWEGNTLGFDICRFDTEFLKVGDDISTAEVVLRRYGRRALEILYELLASTEAEARAKADDTEAFVAKKGEMIVPFVS